jgi:hypothetical protein
MSSVSDGLTRKDRERLDRLRSRCDILRARVAANLNPNFPDHVMELSALEWAITTIENLKGGKHGSDAT